MSELNQKINEHFPGLVVRKDLVRTVKGNAIVPSYVLEYLLGHGPEDAVVGLFWSTGDSFNPGDSSEDSPLFAPPEPSSLKAFRPNRPFRLWRCWA